MVSPDSQKKNVQRAARVVRGAAPAPRAGDSVSMLSIRPHLAGTGEATAAGMKLADDDDDDEVSEGQGEWAWAQRRAAAAGILPLLLWLLLSLFPLPLLLLIKTS